MKLETFVPVIGRLALAIVLAQAAVASAAEIKILATRSFELVIKEIGPEFEQATGHKLTISIGLAAPQKRKIDAGEAFDVAILTPRVIDHLIEEGKIVAGTRTDVLRVGTGVAVRKGAPKPDIGSVEAFKRALLDAKSIAYLKVGDSGVYLAGLLERLGIAADLKAKTKLPELDIVGDLVAKGEAEIGITAVSTLLATPGVEVVGPLPSEVQFYVVFTAGIGANAQASEAASELISFLKGPTAIPVIRAKGMEPG
jgi:molybdate transport system substrate-binding protein